MFAPCVPIRCVRMRVVIYFVCTHFNYVDKNDLFIVILLSNALDVLCSHSHSFRSARLLLGMTVEISIYGFFIGTNNKLLHKATAISSPFILVAYDICFSFSERLLALFAWRPVSLIQLIAICVRVRCIVTFNTKPKYKCTQCICFAENRNLCGKADQRVWIARRAIECLVVALPLTPSCSLFRFALSLSILSVSRALASRCI